MVGHVEWLIKVCWWVMWRHTFTHHNSSYDEFWHKIILNYVSLTLLKYWIHIQHLQSILIRILKNITFRSCLVELLNNSFSVFKQRYIYFYIFFHSRVFQKTTNNVKKNSSTKPPINNLEYYFIYTFHIIFHSTSNFFFF